MSLIHRALDAWRRRDALRRGLSIGEGCEILNGWRFGSEPYLVRLGNHVRVCANVNFITHDGGMWVLRGKYPGLEDADLFGRIDVGDNCHIGTGVTIMPGVSVGRDCVIGCNAVVTHDIPDGSVAVGVPARVIRTIEEYRLRHQSDIVLTKHLSWGDKREFLVGRMQGTRVASR